MVDTLLSPSHIEDLCHEAFDTLSHTWGDGTLTWDGLSQDEKTLVESITVKVVHRLQRDDLFPLLQHEHSFVVQLGESDTGSAVLLRFCSRCGLTSFLPFSQRLNSHPWRKVKEEEA